MAIMVVDALITRRETHVPSCEENYEIENSNVDTKRKENFNLVMMIFKSLLWKFYHFLQIYESK